MTTPPTIEAASSTSGPGARSPCSTTSASTTRSSASWSTPGKRLSYQRHAQRAEHWFIVSGTATVVARRRRVRAARRASSIDIAIGQAHRCENRGTAPVVFIEVQHGTYFGEDDIVRLEDDFGRAG